MLAFECLVGENNHAPNNPQQNNRRFPSSARSCFCLKTHTPEVGGSLHVLHRLCSLLFFCPIVLVFLTNLKTTFPYFPQPQKETTPLLHQRFAKTARMKTGTWSFWCCALGFIFLQSFFNHFRHFGSHLQKTPQK